MLRGSDFDMCDFCAKHSTGKYWYKWASRYARQMYHRNRVGQQPEGAGTNLEMQFGILALQAMQAKNLEPEKFPELVATVNRMARDIHCGQVITLEDAQKHD